MTGEDPFEDTISVEAYGGEAPWNSKPFLDVKSLRVSGKPNNRRALWLYSPRKTKPNALLLGGLPLSLS